MSPQEGSRSSSDLAVEISRLARAHDNKALLAIDTDVDTARLLDEMAARERKKSEAHLRGARVWKAKQAQKARAKLDSAANEIAELDLVLARGILRKVDPEILDEEDLARYDELLMSLEARAIELEEIESNISPSTSETKEKRRFWGR